MSNPPKLPKRKLGYVAPKSKLPRHSKHSNHSKPPRFVLGKDTQKVIELITHARTHVEMIGPAGTGKTFTLKRLAWRMQTLGIPYVMTASTGRAALNIGGQTIHSFSGCGIGDEDAKVYIQKVTKSPWYRKAWTQIRVLIIEEVSMLTLEYFELLDAVAKAVRKSDKPFGGLQVLVCGDYMQLPPVRGEYVFKSKIYKQLYGSHANTVVFKDIKRQSCTDFIKILSEARLGNLSDDSIAKLKACVEKPVPKDLAVEPMILFARRTDVHGYNMDKLGGLDGDAKVFKYTYLPAASLSQKQNDVIESKLKRDVQAPMELTLKVNAQVMLLRNMPKLNKPKFNGSIGIVTSFHPETNHPIVKFVDGLEIPILPAEWHGAKKKGTYIQYPLMLGWAWTIHKSQGSTIDCARIDLGSNANMPNQAYTALSRVRSLDGLYLDAFDPDAFRAHPEARAYHAEIGEFAGHDLTTS